MSNKIIISTDSTADLEYLYKERNIDYLPLTVSLGEETGFDIIDVTPEKIFKYYEDTQMTPKTSSVSPDAYLEYFKKQTELGNEVIHFTISQKMSSCYQNACFAAQQCKGVRVIDSEMLSTGIGLQVLYAYDLVKEGYTADEIEQKINERKNDVNTSFVIDTLEFLAKGGRCNGVVAFLASVLQLKPEIIVKNGEMIVGKKYLGKISVALKKYTKETLAAYPDMDTKYIFVTHSYADPELVELTKKTIEETIPNANVYVTTAGSTVTSHCGKGTLGILFYKHKIQ